MSSLKLRKRVVQPEEVRSGMGRVVDPPARKVTVAAAFDGVSELWFDAQADFEAAYATPHGQAVAADSMAHVSRRERFFVAEHRIVARA